MKSLISIEVPVASLLMLHSFVTEAPASPEDQISLFYFMDIISRRLNLDEFKDYVESYYFGSKPANKLVIHHTWKPRIEDWQGQRSINGLKAYYERKGWPVGPHLFIAEDGIWLFSPMRKDGIHASSLNYRSIGIEVVGDYDLKKWEGKTKYFTLGAVKTLMDNLGIAEKDIFFHRDVSPKSCPGWAITKEWFFQELTRYRGLPRIPTPADTFEPAPFPAPESRPGEIMIPIWAAEAVLFVEKYRLFEIRSDEDVRDAVKFHRLYKLIKSET